MSLVLNLASIRCFRNFPVRGIQCSSGLNSLLKLAISPRVNCVMPKTLETERGFRSLQNSSNLSVRPRAGFTMIYYLREQHALRLASLGSTVLALLTVWSIYEYRKETKDPVSNAEASVPTQERESRDSDMRSWWGQLMTFRIPALEMSDSDKVYNFIILPFIVALLLYSRSHVVMCSYRRGGEYITTITKRFGFGNLIVKHGPGEVIYFPQRMIYKHEIRGQKVLMFSEYFVSNEEEQIMCTGNVHDMRRGDLKKGKED